MRLVARVFGNWHVSQTSSSASSCCRVRRRACNQRRFNHSSLTGQPLTEGGSKGACPMARNPRKLMASASGCGLSSNCRLRITSSRGSKRRRPWRLLCSASGDEAKVCISQGRERSTSCQAVAIASRRAGEGSVPMQRLHTRRAT